MARRRRQAPGLEDRRVEITGPTDRKMTINALNSGAKVWLADFEDAEPDLGQHDRRASSTSRRDPPRHRLHLTEEGKYYGSACRGTTADDHGAAARLAPGGEAPRCIDGRADRRGSLVDFGLYFFHNAKQQIDAGQGPYFYLPKIENHLEARLWNDVFVYAQSVLGIPRGTIRATVLIETIPAAFEMDEILYELRDHSAGLNAGRWDYIFSMIKNFRDRGPSFCCPTATRSP